MKNRYVIIFAAVFAAVATAFTDACCADIMPGTLKNARIVFDSDRDLASDGVRSVYLWEDGRVSRLFKGAVCPRWSPDGESIACVLKGREKDGEIAILNCSGIMKTEITPMEKAEAVEWLDGNNLVYVGRKQKDAETGRSLVILYELPSNNERVLYSTRDSGEIYQINWNRGRDNLILDLKDGFSEEAGFERRAVLLDIRPGGVPKIIHGYNAYKPAIFHDDNTLIFQTDLDMAGNPVKDPAAGALTAYDMDSGEWAGIRDALSVQNTRFSNDGNYFYSAEGESNDSAVIRLFSVDDLNRAILRISPKGNWLSKPYKDLRPDLFLPDSVVTAAAALPVSMSGGIASAGGTTEGAAAQAAVAGRAPVARVPGAVRPLSPERLARPRLSERLDWRPAADRPVIRKEVVPDATPRELSQIDSRPGVSLEKTPSVDTTKTYYPPATSGNTVQTGLPARPESGDGSEVYMKEYSPGMTKTTAGMNEPLQKGQQIYSEADEPLPAPGGTVQTSVPVVPSGLPKGVRVPPGARPIPRGWVIETSMGDKITVEYAADGKSYTVTESGPNFNSKTTYPVQGAKQN
ncbi:MAG: PD40 domain-containing protein [Candidatus Omnitrophica bacterium]|nr:PD40 domain-containing protein [Candidatus Omnitrophota bacterium]